MALNNAGKTLCIFRGMSKANACSYIADAVWTTFLAKPLQEQLNSNLKRLLLAFKIPNVTVIDDNDDTIWDFADALYDKINGIKHKTYLMSDNSLQISESITKEQLATAKVATFSIVDQFEADIKYADMTINGEDYKVGIKLISTDWINGSPTGTSSVYAIPYLINYETYLNDYMFIDEICINGSGLNPYTLDIFDGNVIRDFEASQAGEQPYATEVSGSTYSNRRVIITRI